ncbi:MAG TPA: hypothetical protein VG267_02230 [Terracidiphilus sp.]|jgi:hypothetical protein|nr:hypothetical protein [Terracidiphilus sp.]
MKRAVAVAAVIALLGIPAIAQHGGAHVGGGGHAASGGFASHGGGFASHGGGFASHGGFAGAAPRYGGLAPRSGGLAPRYGGVAPRVGNFRPQGYAPRGYLGPGRTGYAPRAGAPMYRAPYRGDSRYRGDGYGRGGNGYGHEGDRDHHRRRYDRGFNGLNYGYGYPAYPWYPIDIDPWLLQSDWDNDSGDSFDNSGQAGDYGNVPAPYQGYGEPDTDQPGYGEPGPGYGAPPQGYAAPQPYPQSAPEQYQPQSTPGARRPYTGISEAPVSQETVTLIFKDGRSPEKIHNYMLTSSTLTVLDAPYRKIPVDQIDVAATQEANREADIRFQVPNAAN